MKKNKNLIKYIIVFSIPILILLSMIFNPLMTIMYGKEIMIETKPYDPKDLFLGDYVVLNYKINSIPLTKFDKEIIDEYTRNVSSNEEVYVVLKDSNTKYYEVSYVTLKKPKNSIYLRGKISSYYLSENKTIDMTTPVSVIYNLENYYIPENTGKLLEDKSRKGQLIAKINVRGDYSILKEVY